VYWIYPKPVEEKCNIIHQGTAYWSAPKSSSFPVDFFSMGLKLRRFFLEFFPILIQIY